MASSIDTVQYIVDQSGLGRRLESKKMFGEYALYMDSKVVALICDDQLFLKPTPEGQSFLGNVSEAPPYPGAKNYYLLVSEIDDPDRLGPALQITANALPAAKPKSVRKNVSSRQPRKAKYKKSSKGRA